MKTSSFLTPAGGPARIAVPDLRAVLTDWLMSLAPCTRRAYSGDLEDFSRFAGADAPIEAIRLLVQRGPGVANMTALRYRNHLAERKLAPATVARRIAALRSAVVLLRVAGLVAWQLEVRAPKLVPRRDVRGPDLPQVRALLAAAGEEGEKALRDRALVLTLFGLATRRAEAVSLNVGHVDFAGNRVSILGKGRGGEREPFTLPGPTAKALRAYLASRGNPTSGPLFVNVDRARKGGRLTGDGLRRILAALSERAGIRRVRPHGLRHSAITAALDRGYDVREVLRFSRHRDPKTLLGYDDARKDFGGEIAAEVAGLVQDERNSMRATSKLSEDAGPGAIPRDPGEPPRCSRKSFLSRP